MKNKKSKKKIRRIKATKKGRVDAFGIFKGAPPFSRKDKEDSHF